jgi:hypothetical protein
MAHAALGVLDKFYTLPHLPAVALQYKDRAYFNRHAWAAARYYGIDNLACAQEHLQAAARYYPQGVPSGRFLQSLIYARDEHPSLSIAQAAVRFALQVLGQMQLPAHIERKLRARSHLVLSLHAGVSRPARLIRGIIRALILDPLLAVDRDLWAAASRLPRRLISRLGKRAALPVQPTQHEDSSLA